MINVMRIIAGRSRQMVPQTAVLGSSAVGMISGSGSANAAVVGTITIPLMMRCGVPPAFAAAVETAASMGGLLMPPMMGVGAFLMSDYLGVPYWEVVKRGFALAIVYYVSSHRDLSMCVRLYSAGRSSRAGSAYENQDVSYPRYCTCLSVGWVAGRTAAERYTASFSSCCYSRVPLFKCGLHEVLRRRRYSAIAGAARNHER